jgi:ribosomal protein S8E
MILEVYSSPPLVHKSKLIINAAATLSQNISNNTFTNLNVNTTGAIIFISNNVVLSSAGTQDVNNNAIVGFCPQ